MSSEKYIPSNEEIKKAEDSMGVVQRVMSQRREKIIQENIDNGGVTLEEIKGISYDFDKKEYTIGEHKIKESDSSMPIEFYEDIVKSGQSVFPKDVPYMFIDGVEITDLVRIKAFKKKYRRAMQNAMLLTGSSLSEDFARQRIEHNPTLKAEHQEEALRTLDGLL